MTRFAPTFAALLAVACWGGAALGQFNTGAPLAEHRFLAGWWMQRESGTVNMSGIQVKLAEGWKTYWRAPGEFGLPPRLELVEQTNVARLQMHFPRPSVFIDNGMRTIGYADEVVFPIEIIPFDHMQPARANVLLHLGVCMNVCVPVTLEVPFQVFPGHHRNAKAIEVALSKSPVRVDTSDPKGHAACNIDMSGSGKGYRITYEFDYDGKIGPRTAAVFESFGDPIWFSDALLHQQHSGRLSAIAQMNFFGDGMAIFRRSNLRVTLISGQDYIEFVGCNENLTAR